MTDRPILFSAPMVRAIIREIERPGTGKTQTRRVLKLPTKGIYEHPQMGGWEAATVGGPGVYLRDGMPAPEKVAIWHQTCGTTIVTPYQVGDRLWVRETWAPLDALTHSDPGVQALADRGFYRADESTVEGEISRWRPGIHMPRSASRLTLTVTEVRVQQLKEISEADAIAEGCPGRLGPNPDFPDEWDPSPAEEYRDLWNSLNAARGFGWDANPWVVVVAFDPKLGNIDELRT